jgi:hypothetical protein
VTASEEAAFNRKGLGEGVSIAFYWKSVLICLSVSLLPCVTGSCYVPQSGLEPTPGLLTKK